MKDPLNKTFTVRQGQFLAYIQQYTMINGCAPAEADIQNYFRITPPSVHSMVLTLERRGLIRRVPGQARSITLIVLPESLPPLETPSISRIKSIKNTNKKPAGWNSVCQQLAKLEKPELLALLKNLYEANADNRDFIQACTNKDNYENETLKRYRSKISAQFFPARGDGELNFKKVSQAIHDYRQATGNISGTAELLMTFVENGTRFTHLYGDMDERFYDSVESALEELATLLRGEVRATYQQLSDRLAKVEQMACGIGWGFHDFVSGIVVQLEEELA